jgi:site-specific DNA-adenine methylase
MGISVNDLSAPFPWFGGKSTVADRVWRGLGNVEHYVEPFFGSGAVLLNRPHAAKVETVNDKDGLLANFWRAVRVDPDAVAHHADWPTNEADLHARHLWLVGQREPITERLMGDPDYYDAKAAGIWVWGSCNWIGSGFCSGEGPWIAVDGVLIDRRQLPHLSAGQGIYRKLPHLGDAGRGINRQLPHLGNAGRGDFIRGWMADLSARLREVRVACGDWSRVCGPSVLGAGGGKVGVFLDPPYDQSGRSDVYAQEGSFGAEIDDWCLKVGTKSDTRIVVAGYDGEHAALIDAGWRVEGWKASGGYGSQGNGAGRDNARREMLWFSPGCLSGGDLFEGMGL